MRRRGRYLPFLICLVFLLTGCSGKEKDTLLKMTFLDTGKSDCIVIEAGAHVVVNDTADEDDMDTICAFLDERQANKIDYLILSHFDKDHIGSAAGLTRRYEVGQVLMPDYKEDSEAYQALMEAMEETDTAYTRLREDVSFSLDGIDFYVDAPQEAFYDNDNNYSLITAVTNKNSRFLLMGDAKKERTEEFLDSPVAGDRYDLIKMPHHGNYNKKLKELFITARPRYAVLTPGAERTRVEEDTIALLESARCSFFYTDEGVVTAVSDGRSVEVSQRTIP